MRFAFAPLALALAVAGCASVGPDYHRQAPAPLQLDRAGSAQVSGAAFEAAWWRQFGDPTLDALIRRAAAGNLDLRIAVARLDEARALLGTAKSARRPDVDLDAGYTRSKAQQPGFGSDRVSVDGYRAGFDASWELDLFGGVRRGVEAARADSEAGAADVQAAQVSVIAEVARNYFELRGTQLRMDVVRRDIENLRQTLALTRARLDVGSASEQDVASAAARLSAVEAQQPALQIEARRAEDRLAVLLGARPGELGIDLSPAGFKPIDAVLPIGDAADVLQRRPDVRAAERRLAAATARIGVAKADFFPHISLGGFIGFIAGRSADLGEASSKAWSIAPSISWSGLNVRRVRSNLRASEARADAAQAQYEQSVLQAVEDVDNALTAFDRQRARVAKLIEQARQSRRAADLAGVRYREGAADFLELLDAERTALDAEDDLAQAETAVNTGAVAVYKALGGGWQACGDARCTQVAQARSEPQAPR